ncbi:hypothetical protein EMPS_01942 [Entomortierella parvispora]|uniref:Galactose oxidase n=1 Tax=Entomortierella parvispora TaxID=205924 RepID=A0A9P3LTG1_9FUNG|nr:hypothetical protein EMPS_01942 [Entomortierella parvispora]
MQTRTKAKAASKASVFVILLSCIVSSTQAQSSQPQSVGGAAFVRIGSNFYIQGGALYADNLVQSLWSLDLSSPWNTSNPSWTSLPPGPYNGFHSAGFSSDNSTLYTFGRDTAASASQIAPSWLNIYDIASKTWSAPASNPASLTDNSRRDFTVVTNPGADKIYILGGDGGPAGATTSDDFNVYDPATKGLTQTAMTTGPQNAVTYGAVWIPRLSNMLVIGGGNNPASLWTYTPSTGAWATQATTGNFSYSRSSPCAASNADGSLVAVFGGFLGGSGAADPNAYVLNTITWTWTTVPYAARGRGNAACTVVDDIFMVWGGFYTNPNTNGGVPTGAECLLLLDLQKLQWILSYTPSSAMISGGNSGGNGSNKSSSGMSAGAIGGIGTAAIVILVIIAWNLLARIRRKSPSHQKVPQQEESELGRYAAPGSGGDGTGTGFGGGGVGNSHVLPSTATSAAHSYQPPILDASLVYAAQQPQQQQYDLQQQYQQLQYQQQQEQLQYQNQYQQPSSNMTAGHYAPPGVEPTVGYNGYCDAEDKSNGGSQYDGASAGPGYPSPPSTAGGGPVPTIYYPPPPVSVTSSSGPEEKGTPATLVGAPQTTPYGYSADGYHDSYGTKDEGGNKRASAPQGGQGFGTVDEGAALGAPQAIIRE